MLYHKDIITRYSALGMSGGQIDEVLKVSKSGVNDFLRAFKACPTLDYRLVEIAMVSVFTLKFTSLPLAYFMLCAF